jgi:hypothetical protein
MNHSTQGNRASLLSTLVAITCSQPPLHMVPRGSQSIVLCPGRGHGNNPTLLTELSILTALRRAQNRNSRTQASRPTPRGSRITTLLSVAVVSQFGDERFVKLFKGRFILNVVPVVLSDTCFIQKYGFLALHLQYLISLS